MFRKQELKLIAYILGLYVSFVYWGYLQEKLTSKKYTNVDNDEVLRWDFAFVLNWCMALGAFLMSSFFDLIYPSTAHVPFLEFAYPALTLALASPIGYTALKFINFPLLILAKSSKPVPVMVVGVTFFKKKYPWYKYVSVLLLCGGIGVFTAAGKSYENKKLDILRQLFGIALIVVNLFLDGYTNNQQDHIFHKHKISSFQMMKFINSWQLIYLGSYVAICAIVWRGESELFRALYAMQHCPEIIYDVALFCFFAAVGQIIIFAVMKEFGSLLWVTVSITRKLLTILFSVFMFGHTVTFMQWMGIASVFGGMSLEVGMNYVEQYKIEAKKKDEKKKE